MHEEKIAAIQEKLELSDQKLAQYSKLPEMEEQLKARMEALNQVGSQVGTVSKRDVLINIFQNSNNHVTKSIRPEVFCWIPIVCVFKFLAFLLFIVNIV